MLKHSRLGLVSLLETRPHLVKGTTHSRTVRADQGTELHRTKEAKGPGSSLALWYVPRYDRLGGNLTSSSLLSAATFKETEKQKRGRDRNRLVLTPISSYGSQPSLHLF